MAKRIGKSTVIFKNTPCIKSFAAAVGKKEGEGPLGKFFDEVNDDTSLNEKTWEKAESRLQTNAVKLALEKGGLSAQDVDYIFAGDLLNQCISSAYGLRDFGIPYGGLYGACSTMAESLCIGSIFAESGAAQNCVCVTSSHFCSAERQFRFPLEYGSQRTPTAQWTVTGSGCAVVAQGDKPPYVNAVTMGKIIDLGVTDVNNMGAAMAPAAADTIKAFLNDTQTSPDDYDLILTGDLGQVGSELLCKLLQKDGIDISRVHNDCGLMIYDMENQAVNAGASGCGCSASVLCGYILDKVKKGEIKKLLFAATGALMSPTSLNQGESIPGICHLLYISHRKEVD